MIIKPTSNDKILILGARGNLGGQLMRVLGNSYRLLCWDRDELDVRDFEKLSALILENRPDFIINCAAYNAVDKCEESEEEFTQAKVLNSELPGVLADLAVKLDATLIHFVSDYVFDGQKKTGYSENDQPNPLNRYGQSKWAGEKAVLERRDKGLKFYLVRTSKLFGPKGESEKAKPSFFDIMLELSRKKEYIEVVDSEISCFTYTPDLAKAIEALIRDKNAYGIYHIVNAGAVTWYQAARTLFSLAKTKINLIPVSSDKFPRPARRPAYSELKNTKLPPLRNYEEALGEYLQVVNNHY